MAIRVQREDFDLGAELKALTEGRSDIGGLASFVGLVRDMAPVEGERQEIAAMTLEHYPGMTEKMLAEIEAEARERWPLEATLIVTNETMMVGLRTAPEAEVVVPIDMTLPVGLDYQDARNSSFGARIAAMGDPISSGFAEADVTSLRARGVAPIP